jgi:hypothetical protein
VQTVHEALLWKRCYCTFLSCNAANGVQRVLFRSDFIATLYIADVGVLFIPILENASWCDYYYHYLYSFVALYFNAEFLLLGLDVIKHTLGLNLLNTRWGTTLHGNVIKILV